MQINKCGVRTCKFWMQFCDRSYEVTTSLFVSVVSEVKWKCVVVVMVCVCACMRVCVYMCVCVKKNLGVVLLCLHRSLTCDNP